MYNKIIEYRVDVDLKSGKKWFDIYRDSLGYGDGYMADYITNDVMLIFGNDIENLEIERMI